MELMVQEKNKLTRCLNSCLRRSFDYEHAWNGGGAITLKNPGMILDMFGSDTNYDMRPKYHKASISKDNIINITYISQEPFGEEMKNALTYFLEAEFPDYMSEKLSEELQEKVYGMKVHVEAVDRSGLGKKLEFVTTL